MDWTSASPLLSERRTSVLLVCRPNFILTFARQLTTIRGANMFSSQNRIALVTGGGRGIGRAIAVALAKAGARVGGRRRTTVELEEVVYAITKAGGHAVALASDLAQKDAPVKLMEQVA